MKSKLVFNGFTLTGADTVGGVTWNRSVNSGENLAYGTAALADVKFTVLMSALPSGTTLAGQTFTLWFDQSEAGGDFANYGVFTVRTADKSGNKISVAACDNMYKFDVSVDTWLNSLIYPVTLYSLLSSLCTYCGVALGTASVTNGGYSIARNFSATGITGREVLGYIAEAAAAFAYIGADGKLYLKRYTASGVTIDNTKYIRRTTAEYTSPAIDKVTIRVSSNDIGVSAGSGTNIWTLENNPLLYTDTTANLAPVASALLNAAAQSYVPSVVELFSDFGLDTGDIFTLDGKTTLVMNKTMKPSGVALSCAGMVSRAAATGAVTAEIKRLRGASNELSRTLEATVSRLTDAEGSISTLTQTANSLQAQVSANDGDIATLNMTANKIDWLVASGTTAANFTMTSRAIQQVAENINLTGYVTIAALSGSGTTTVNGDNITTGNISADRIAANNSTYITFNSPLYLNAAYPQIYGLDALYFGPDHDCAIVGNNSNYSGANTIQLRAPGGLYHYDGAAVRTVLTTGNIASYITFQ